MLSCHDFTSGGCPPQATTDGGGSHGGAPHHGSVDHHQSAPELRNVYVASLPKRFTTNDLNNLVRPYGEVHSCVLFGNTMQATFTGHAYGFVLFTSQEDAARAIAGLNDVDIEGRRLRVQLARQAPRPAGPPAQPPPPAPPAKLPRHDHHGAPTMTQAAPQPAAFRNTQLSHVAGQRIRAPRRSNAAVDAQARPPRPPSPPPPPQLQFQQSIQQQQMLPRFRDVAPAAAAGFAPAPSCWPSDPNGGTSYGPPQHNLATTVAVDGYLLPPSQYWQYATVPQQFAAPPQFAAPQTVLSQQHSPPPSGFVAYGAAFDSSGLLPYGSSAATNNAQAAVAAPYLTAGLSLGQPLGAPLFGTAGGLMHSPPRFA